MLGPNCVGLMNTHTPINASFASGFPSRGNISFISQTGILAGSNRANDAAFKQSGVLRVEIMNELFDLARAFSAQPLPLMPRVAIANNAGGLCHDVRVLS